MTLNDQQIESFETAISGSLRKVYDHDKYLIDYKVHERTIVGRFIIYFQQRLNEIGYSDYHLDIEYNKDESNPKRTENFENGTYPDVIVHKRGSNEHNLCLIEFKTYWNSDIQTDIEKLTDFTSETGKYKYGIGFSITLNRDTPVIQVIEKGQVLNFAQLSEVSV